MDHREELMTTAKCRGLHDCGRLMRGVILIAAVMALLGLGACGQGTQVSEPPAAGASASETTVEPVSETERTDRFRESDFVSLPDSVQIKLTDKKIIQSGTTAGTAYQFTINLEKWEKKTSPAQIVTISELFWQCYPKMYQRFGASGESPTEVTLAIENEGYEIAETSGNFVHLHDRWLHDFPTDYDCLTHEFAHVIQNGWNGENLEFDSYIERFADYCRFVYAFNHGAYNDACWTLQTVEAEPDRESSVRFLVWLDYTYSTSDHDLMLTYFDVCRNRQYPPDAWDAAWQEIFTGTPLKGMTIDEVWELYASSDFAYLFSVAEAPDTSELLAAYDIRGKIESG